MKGNNTRIDTVKWDFSETSICNKSALVSSIMLHIKHKVNSYLLVAIRWFCSSTQVLEGHVFMKLSHLKGIRVLPLGVVIVLSSSTAWL